MKGLATIRAESRRAAEAAAGNNKVPFVVEEADLEDWRATVRAGRLPRLPFPFIGDYVPEGWETVASPLFVDSSGLGSPSEPALTIPQLLDKLEVGKGYAITRTGQFQLYLGVYQKTS